MSRRLGTGAFAALVGAPWPAAASDFAALMVLFAVIIIAVILAVQALVGIVAQPFIMGVCSAGKTEWEGRVGFTVGNLVKHLIYPVPEPGFRQPLAQ